MEVEVQAIAAMVRGAAQLHQPLRIVGGDSKEFYGNPCAGETLNVGSYRGVIDYDPNELMLTARAGTALTEVEQLLAETGQLLAFEPPQFGGGTLGGSIATGLSGPRRAYAGAARDFILGVRLIDGRGNDLRFGGRVMKNVAGYDVSRLMVGAQGTLGVLMEISLRVLPARAEITLSFEGDQAFAIDTVNQWSARGLPITASCFHDGILHARFAGMDTVLRRLRSEVGGELVQDGAPFWRAIRDHTATFFSQAQTLWRISLPATTAPLDVMVPQLIEWGGALRWLAGTPNAAELRARVERAGGHATLFRAAYRDVAAFHPLKPPVAALHRELKRVFDPVGILNPRRFYDI